MSRRPARFTEADIRRAGKVAKELGMEIAVELDGTICIRPMENRVNPIERSKPLVF